MLITINKYSDLEIKKILDKKEFTEIRVLNEPFILRIHQNRKKGSWYFICNKKGKTERKKISTYPLLTATELKKIKHTLISKFTQEEKIKLDEFNNVSDVLIWYNERAQTSRSLCKERKKNIKSAIEKHLKPALGEFKINEINKKILNNYFWGLQEKYNLSYVRALFLIFRHAFLIAVKLELINNKFISSLTFKDFNNSPILPKGCKLTKTDISMVLIQINNAKERKRIFCYLLILFGLRIGETRKLKKSFFDFDNKILILPARITKTKKQLTLPITEQAERILKPYIEKKVNYLFDSKDNSNKHIVSVTANKYIQDVSAKKWTAHDLRKIARSMWADLGVDYFVAEILLNHKLSLLDQTYIHTYADEKKRDALTIWHDYLMNETAI